VRAFLSENRIVLFISHRLEEIESLCHRVTVLRDGRDVGAGPLAEMPERRLVELMLGETSERVLAGETHDVQRTKEAPVVVTLEQYSSEPELRETDLEIREGEIVGVAGLEGQGQLELFLALYGARRSSGRATVRGKTIHGRSPRGAIRDGVGLVPHDRGLALCLPLSIRDNVTLGSLRLVSRAGIISRAREARLVARALSALRVRARSMRQLVETLSGGNQQKVLLGRVLTSRPELLLMYDATRGVDVGTKAEIFHLMREQVQAGVAILFYSTDAAELTAMCDRVIVLHDGRIRAELSGADLTQERIIAAAIGGGRGG
jgi:ABC-type sugar transport system ATPase subunit